MRKKVLVLFGGNSTEHQVSCMSTQSILTHIDYKKYIVMSAGINKKGEWFIFDSTLDNLMENKWEKTCYKNKIDNIAHFVKKFDVVLPIIHGNVGEDGKLQGFLETLNVPYVGCNVLSSAICMNKSITKLILNTRGIPQVPYYHLTDKLEKEIKNIEDYIGYPAIVKPSNGGSSVGINKANNFKELKKAIKEAKKFDKSVLIEKFIIGQELECSVLENKSLIASLIGEIIPNNEFYDYSAKYIDNKTELIIPAKISKDLEAEIKSLSLSIFKILKCKDLARVDFLYDLENKKLYFNEINTIPGFTNISMYPKLIEKEGISYQKLISILIDNNV